MTICTFCKYEGHDVEHHCRRLEKELEAAKKEIDEINSERLAFGKLNITYQQEIARKDEALRDIELNGCDGHCSHTAFTALQPSPGGE